MRKKAQQMDRVRGLCFFVAWLVCSALALASPYRGTVTFGGLPLPGALITATQGTKSVSAVSDSAGAFTFDDLADGTWTIDVQMQGFVPIHSEATIASNLPAATWEMKLLPLDQIAALSQPAKPSGEPTQTLATRTESQTATQQPMEDKGQGKTPENAQGKPQNKSQDKSQNRAQNDAQSASAEIPTPPQENEQSADGFLVQGSVNNAATSIYATNPAFGNTRSGMRALYTGGFEARESNSALNARPYSLSGVEAAKPASNDFTGAAALQGQIKIPHLLPRGPNFFVSYQWTRNSSSVINTGLVPTRDERTGNLAGLTNALGQAVTIYDPATGLPYTNNRVPVSAQAAALLALYPQPNITNASSSYNYQAPVLNATHQDGLESRLDKTLGRKDQLYGGFAFQSARSDSVNLFGFVDEAGTLGVNTNVHWTHRLKPSLFLFTGYTFSRLRTELTPNFAGRVNVSGNAEITGNDQDAANWGPPALNFSSGLAGLSDANSSFNRNRTDAVSASIFFFRGKHNISAGGDFRKQEYNDFFQQNPRGAFTFTGAATAEPGGNASTTGSDLADFLIGIPDASAIAYGNADKYFREPVYDAYFTDDWRVLPILTVNAGARWDYSAPITELFGRLVNLDVASGFGVVAAVEGSNPVGAITGAHYPASLVRPERRMFEPRIGVTWRPVAASTIVIRAGYGIYPDTSVYQNIVLNMAQQAPLSKSLTVANSVACPLTLANGFTPCASVTSDSFGIDPNFRIGYVQTWQLSVQRDLPFALQMTVAYTGVKGTHGPQQILPNSYPLGESNPCASCASGFIYETSNGDSIRHAGQLQLRRRLRGGLAATLAYTYSKSIDDDAYLGGQGHTTGASTQSASLSTPSAAVAQNWLDPKAERSLSEFDQRHLLSVQTQYTSGQGLTGGTLMSGWRGKALKEWTVLGNLSYGTGLPETPLYPAAVPGTGFTGILRPELTGVAIYSTGTGPHLNADAYAEPAGQWGTAGRNSITGPNQLTFNSSLARTFRPRSKVYLDFTLSSTNSFNHVSFSSWNNLVTSDQFGLPVAPGGMRSMQVEIHLRFE